MTTTVSAPAPVRRSQSRWWALVMIGLAQLLVIIDTTIVNIALPSAQRELGMSDVARQWTISAYTLAFGGLLLLGGRLADRLGRKNTLIVGALGFAIASAVGGAATGPAMLIGARAAQGVFAALLAPSTLSLLTITFTEAKERAKAFGIFTAIMMSGGALGLVAGGALAEYLDWRWCLYVNLPLAIIASIGGWLVLPNVKGHRETPLDWISAILGSGGIVGLVYALSEAATRGWGSALVLSILGAAIVLLAAFVLRQSRVDNPLLPLRILRERSRAAAYLTIAAASFGMFGMFLFLTYQLQGIMHYGAFQAGIAFLPFLLGNVLMSTIFSRRLLPRTGPRPLLVIGLLLMAAGLAALTQLTPDSSYWALILPVELVLGGGAGLAMPTVMNIATARVNPADAGVASAFITTSQQVGASIGTASLNTIASSATSSAAGLGVAGATVHGFAVANGWAGAIVAVAGLGVGLLVGNKKQAQERG
ncbi:DHA2 family efflux MFS transporter permease subunit [Amycolatopsis sp.]|uniref:DHA2 family efflux MFS transporter permease subunit n=1 Tax=Amycolatopsis sp. TaxID=37632 RepID=UPI002BFD5FE9|nr:DHA2 family efflux MFS transporter permease subunit [Amycolatopsis sp.]HVV13806.1 DHA2 family efflux MFS transporter permease subunit [Amycolatopsis sp.]